MVASILLMHNRVRAARTETKLRADIGDLQAQADSYQTLLFAEPQIVISWPAGGNRPRISGDTSLVLQQDSPQRILAFGTWLSPEPARQIDHAVDALRETGESFLLNLTTSNGHAIEAMGRAIGGQAIVRIRAALGREAGTRRDQSAAEIGDGRDRDAARLRRRLALADSGPRAPKAS